MKGNRKKKDCVVDLREYGMGLRRLDRAAVGYGDGKVAIYPKFHLNNQDMPGKIKLFQQPAFPLPVDAPAS